MREREVSSYHRGEGACNTGLLQYSSGSILGRGRALYFYRNQRGTVTYFYRNESIFEGYLSSSLHVRAKGDTDVHECNEGHESVIEKTWKDLFYIFYSDENRVGSTTVPPILPHLWSLLTTIFEAKHVKFNIIHYEPPILNVFPRMVVITNFAAALQHLQHTILPIPLTVTSNAFTFAFW